MTTLLSTPDAAKVAGVPFRTLDEWVRTGLVTCRGMGEGHGSRRKWSLLEVMRARLVAELRRMGLPLGRIRRIMEKVGWPSSANSPLLGPEAWLMVVGDDTHWVVGRDVSLSVLAGYPVVRGLVQIPVGAIANDTTILFNTAVSRLGRVS